MTLNFTSGPPQLLLGPYLIVQVSGGGGSVGGSQAVFIPATGTAYLIIMVGINISGGNSKNSLALQNGAPIYSVGANSGSSQIVQFITDSNNPVWFYWGTGGSDTWVINLWGFQILPGS
jgi:hypothetical protein